MLGQQSLRVTLLPSSDDRGIEGRLLPLDNSHHQHTLPIYLLSASLQLPRIAAGFAPPHCRIIIIPPSYDNHSNFEAWY